MIFPLFLLAVKFVGARGGDPPLPGFPTDSYLTFALGLTFHAGRAV